MFGQYSAFIIPSYLVTALVIAGLIVWSLVDYRLRLRELEELERRGIKRRAAAGKSDD
ncbi:MAG: heme exporter protein CcmD [Nitratireductor sp.]